MAKLVTFLKSATVGCLFNEGETASFDDAVADDLIERKIAKPAPGKGKGTAKDDAAKKAAEEEAAKIEAIRAARAAAE